MTEEQTVQFFKCLGDRSRLRIIQSLLQEEMYGELLSQRLGLSPATVSFHLKKLEEAGLVTARQEQYYMVYTLQRRTLQQTVVDIIAQADDQISQQERREAAYRQKVLAAFFQYGRLRSIPAQWKKEVICLEELVQALEPGRVYEEQELNQVLLGFYDDYCTLRRDMIAAGLLKREKGKYWREE